MDWAPASVVRWLFASEQGASDRLISRWIFLRALGLIYFSAFFSLVFQIRGLIGPQGILPANDYLQAVGRSPWPPCPPVVRTYAALAFKQFAIVAGVVLGRNVCIAGTGSESLAACDAHDLLRLFLVVRERGTGFLWLSVRRYAARSWIHLAFLCPSGYPPRLGRSAAANTRQSLPSAMGVVPHLLRIGHRKDRQRRSPVAQPDRDGRVLPEWALAHLDRLVCAASAALVSCFERIRHACAGVGSGVDAVPASALADPMLFHRHPMGNRCHSHG